MLDLSRGRDGAGHCRMSNDPFQEKLRPRPAIEFAGPIGQRFRSDAREQIATTEGPIGEDRDSAILGEGKDLFLRLALA
jgi:hypothetical protein